MKRTKYKNNYAKEHYERLVLSVPKGLRNVIKSLAEEKNLSTCAYIFDLINKDQDEKFDKMQISEKNKKRILTISGNTQDGYLLVLKTGEMIKCRTKLDVRKCLAQDTQCLAQDRVKS